MEQALSNSIENDTPTIASCAGHKMFDFPYISLEINEKNKGNILSVINKMSDYKNVEISLSSGRGSDSLTIYSRMGNKDEMFKAIAEAVSEKANINDVNEITNSLWSTYNSMKNVKDNVSDFKLQYKNFTFNKELSIKSDVRNYGLFNISKNSGMKVKGVFYDSAYLKKKFSNDEKVIEQLDKLNKEIAKFEKIFGTSKNFSDEIKFDGEIKLSYANTGEEKESDNEKDSVSDKIML